MSSSESSAAGAVVYQTTVTAVGEQVPAFLEHGILILFGAESPEELHSISVLHTTDVRESGPQAGDLVHIGDTEIPVLAVGEVVSDNLLNLGHLDFKADGRTEAKLPGDVCVAKGSLPTPRVGDVITIVRR
jgi:PTS system glucitol/sorbitol-specific IIA component